MTTFHPDLQSVARFLPRFSIGPKLAALARWAGKFITPAKVEGVSAESVEIPGPPGEAPISVRVYRPEGLKTPSPALLWIHGGGFILGSPEQDELSSATFAKELGIVVVAARYRLAPKHPFPAPMDDCYAALKWLHDNAASLGVRADRIAIGGGSAGGGLAAGLTLLARDRKQIPVAFQLLVYPMLDDRTVTRTDVDGANHRMWTQAANRYGWASYLGKEPGGAEAPIYAAPARAGDLSGLPPTWIGVGTYDLFHDEDQAYVQRLKSAGVPLEVETVERAYHGFDVFNPQAPVVKRFRQSQVDAMRRVLFAG